MKINFNYLQTAATSLKSKLLDELTPLNKKILVIAAIAFSCLAAIYLLRGYIFRSMNKDNDKAVYQDDKKKDEDKPVDMTVKAETPVQTVEEQEKKGKQIVEKTITFEAIKAVDQDGKKKVEEKPVDVKVKAETPAKKVKEQEKKREQTSETFAFEAIKAGDQDGKKKVEEKPVDVKVKPETPAKKGKEEENKKESRSQNRYYDDI